MSYKGNRPNKADFSLFAADQVVVNNGDEYGYRDDRQGLEAKSFVAEHEILRMNEVQALLKECPRQPLGHMQTYLMSRNTHVSEPAIEMALPAVEITTFLKK